MSAEDSQKPAATSAPNAVTKILPNDILLGRGALAIGNEGNVRYRNIIRERKKEYMSTNRRRRKEAIASEVRAEVARRHGRFIRRVSGEGNELHTMGLREGVEGKARSMICGRFSPSVCNTKAWVLSDEATVMQKIKQSLRDKETGSSEGLSLKPEGNTGIHARPPTEETESREAKRSKAESREQLVPFGANLGHLTAAPSVFNIVGDGTPQLSSLGSQVLNFLGQQPPFQASHPLIYSPPTPLQLATPDQSRSIHAHRAALIGQLSLLRQESERQSMIQRIETERNASLSKLQLQEVLLRALRQSSASTQHGPG